MKISLICLCFSGLFAFSSCSTEQKNDAKVKAAQAIGSGVSSTIATVADCSEKEAMAEYLTDEILEWKVFELEQEKASRKGIVNDLCKTVVVGGWGTFKGFVQNQRLFKIGKCTLETPERITLGLVSAACERVDL